MNAAVVGKNSEIRLSGSPRRRRLRYHSKGAHTYVSEPILILGYGYQGCASPCEQAPEGGFSSAFRSSRGR